MTSAGRRSGTRALSVFHPYHIVSAADLRAVSCRLAEAYGHVRTAGRSDRSSLRRPQAATLTGSDDPNHIVRRQRIYRYLRYRNRRAGRLYRPVTRIRSVRPIKVGRH